MSAKSLVGVKVIHISHGKGTIIAFTERPGQTTDIIEVDFDGKAIKYNYPSVFEKWWISESQSIRTASNIEPARISVALYAFPLKPVFNSRRSSVRNDCSSLLRYDFIP